MATESLSNPGLPLVESSAINLEQSTKEMENQQSGQGMEHQQSTEPDLEKQVTATSQPDEPSSSLDGTAVNSLQPQKTNASQVEYVSGIKMYLALASVTMVVFLMLIDISIIATVRTLSAEEKERSKAGTNNALLKRLSPESLVISTPSTMWVGMVVHTCWPSMFPRLQPWIFLHLDDN